MNVTIDLGNKIAGWGSDLDPKNRPAVPMEKTPPHGTGAHWEQPPQQAETVKINMSKERKKITPVFGTKAPPKGLSGVLRNYSYSRFSEDKVRHWLLLILADRVDMIEATFADLARGHVPNLYKEMGLKSEWKYNRSRFVATTAVLIGAVVLLAAVTGASSGAQRSST